MHAELTTATRPGQRAEGSTKRQKPKNNNNKASGTGRQSPPEYISNHNTSGFDHRSTIFPIQPMREFSTSPPPPFSYSYPLPDPGAPAPYPQHTSFQPLPTSYSDYEGQSCYLPPLPTTLPSMPSYELGQGKHDVPLGEDGMLGQFNHPISYTPFSSLDIPHTQSYQDSNAHVNDPFHFPFNLS